MYNEEEVLKYAKKKYNEVAELVRMHPQHADLGEMTRAYWYGVVSGIEAWRENRLPSVPMLMPDSFTL